ncbi:MAG TPA: helix-turn-helix domain-containing protein [Acidimicrobiales bacterium]
MISGKGEAEGERQGEREGATGRRRRAAALPPAERRAAIIEATLPLLLEHGLSVTTRHIAEAAGIAEGTIFRVFPDKESLVQATVDAVIDPTPTERAIEAIDRHQPFEDQLRAAVAVLQRRVAVIWRLFSAIGVKPSRPPQPPLASPALTALLAAHAKQIRLDPAAAARCLRSLTLAASAPALAGEPMTADEIVALFLDGVRARPGPAGPTARADHAADPTPADQAEGADPAPATP